MYVPSLFLPRIKAEQEQRMKEVMEAQRKEYEAHLLELGAQMVSSSEYDNMY